MKINNKIIRLKRYTKPLFHCERSVAILVALALVLSFSLITAVPRAAAANTCWYVDASAEAGGDGTTSAITGINCAFQTISAAITAATAGNIINVAAGTYNENISFNKSVDLLGPNVDISAVTGTRNPEAVIVNQVNLADGISNASINGFEFTGQTGSQVLYFTMDSSDFTVKCNRFINNTSTAINTYASSTHSNLLIDNNLVDGITSHPPNGTGMWIGGIKGTSLISNNKIMNTSYAGILLDNAISVTVSDNIIQNIPQQGIQVANASGDVYITNNVITNANTTHDSDKGGIRLYGSTFTGPVLITGNTITGSFNGVAIKDGENITDKDIHVNFNNLSGNSNYGIYHGGAGSLDAENNWWGDASGPTHPSSNPSGTGNAVSNNVAYYPWYINEGKTTLYNAITITKTGPTTANQGNNIIYTITYKNVWTFNATNVVITETYPPEVEYVSAIQAPDSGFNNRWTIGTLAPNAEGTITVTVHIK